MDHRYYDLPSLTALEVFESSARHLSFKLAASELHVTSGEIRRHIKAIEDELGVPLFVGSGPDVLLTSAGNDLYSLLASSLSKASDVVSAIKRGDYSRNVKFACTDTFESMWWMPRMRRFGHRIVKSS